MDSTLGRCGCRPLSSHCPCGLRTYEGCWWPAALVITGGGARPCAGLSMTIGGGPATTAHVRAAPSTRNDTQSRPRPLNQAAVSSLYPLWITSQLGSRRPRLGPQDHQPAWLAQLRAVRPMPYDCPDLMPGEGASCGHAAGAAGAASIASAVRFRGGNNRSASALRGKIMRQRQVDDKLMRHRQVGREPTPRPRLQMSQRHAVPLLHFLSLCPLRTTTTASLLGAALLLAARRRRATCRLSLAIWPDQGAGADGKAAR